MKKVMLTAALLLALIASLCLVSCNKCEHEYISKITKHPTCVAEGVKENTCDYCGEVKKEVIPALEKHDYTETVIKEADCTNTGEMSYKCKICDHTYTDVIPTNDEHDFESEVIKKASCKEEGTQKDTCKLCGEVQESKIDKLDHEYDGGKVTKKATLSSEGVKQFKCKKCDHKKEETIPMVVLDDVSYDQGMHACPDDIPAGEYILISEGNNGYFAITADDMGNDIIANDNFGPVAHIRIQNGVYLELSRCVAVPYSSDIAFNIVNNGFITGTYKVGKDIPAGSYKLTAISGGYYSISDKPYGKILSNDFFDEGTCYITLKNGQYVEFSTVKIEKK